MILQTEPLPAQLTRVPPLARRILVADGNSDARDLLEFILRRENYEVTTVNNGQQALQSVLDHPPRVLVLETLLPGMNGLEVIKELRARSQFALLPILILSAKAGGD